jgi:hypothetical protein
VGTLVAWRTPCCLRFPTNNVASAVRTATHPRLAEAFRVQQPVDTVWLTKWEAASRMESRTARAPDSKANRLHAYASCSSLQPPAIPPVAQESA